MRKDEKRKKKDEKGRKKMRKEEKREMIRNEKVKE